jgi:hypothetical protein
MGPPVDGPATQSFGVPSVQLAERPQRESVAPATFCPLRPPVPEKQAPFDDLSN